MVKLSCCCDVTLLWAGPVGTFVYETLLKQKMLQGENYGGPGGSTHANTFQEKKKKKTQSTRTDPGFVLKQVKNQTDLLLAPPTAATLSNHHRQPSL